MNYHLVTGALLAPGERGDTLPPGDAIAVRRIGKCVLVEVYVRGGHDGETLDAPQPLGATQTAHPAVSRPRSIYRPTAKPDGKAGNRINSAPLA